MYSEYRLVFGLAHCCIASSYDRIPFWRYSKLRQPVIKFWFKNQADVGAPFSTICKTGSSMRFARKIVGDCSCWAWMLARLQTVSGVGIANEPDVFRSRKKARWWARSKFRDDRGQLYCVSVVTYCFMVHFGILDLHVSSTWVTQSRFTRARRL